MCPLHTIIAPACMDVDTARDQIEDRLCMDQSEEQRMHAPIHKSNPQDELLGVAGTHAMLV